MGLRPKGSKPKCHVESRLAHAAIAFVIVVAQRHSPEWLTLFAVLCGDRKSTRLNSSHSQISYAVFCLKKKKENLVLRLVYTHLYTPLAHTGDCARPLARV